MRTRNNRRIFTQYARCFARIISVYFAVFRARLSIRPSVAPFTPGRFSCYLFFFTVSFYSYCVIIVVTTISTNGGKFALWQHNGSALLPCIVGRTIFLFFFRMLFRTYIVHVTNTLSSHKGFFFLIFFFLARHRYRGIMSYVIQYAFGESPRKLFTVQRRTVSLGFVWKKSIPKFFGAFFLLFLHEISSIAARRYVPRANETVTFSRRFFTRNTKRLAERIAWTKFGNRCKTCEADGLRFERKVTKCND